MNKSGLDKNSVILIYGDHGEGFDHNLFGHGDALYESSVKIPLIMSYPNANKQERSSVLIDNTDILPSILSLLEITYDKNTYDGISFLSSFKTSRKVDTFRKYVTMKSYVASKRAITDGIYKYIDNANNTCPNRDNERELYNLQNDPSENNNWIKINLNENNKLSSAFNIEKSVTTQTTTSSITCLEESSVLEKIKSLGY